MYARSQRFQAIGILALGVSAAAATEVRINCGTAEGASDYVDFLGHVWVPDREFETAPPPRFGYVGGGSVTCSSSGFVGGTVDAALLKTSRAAFDAYRFEVPDGFYAVRLFFVEPCLHAPGLRVFDVVINGQTVRTAFDIAAEVGKDYAVERAYPAVVENGELTVTTASVVGESIVSAISVVSVVPDQQAPYFPSAFDALEGYGRNILTWSAGIPDDLAGYHVYRAESEAGPFERINAELVVTRRYFDDMVTAGTEYFYRVTAVDLWQNESAPTESLSATPLDSLTSNLPVYRLGIDPADLLALDTDPANGATVPATFEHAGQFIESVFARYAGDTEFDNPKKSWELSFDGELFEGRSRVWLMAQFADHSLMRELLSYGVFSVLQRPSPQAYFVHLLVNGEYHGVHLDVEDVGQSFLIAHGFSGQGGLYRASTGTLDVLLEPEHYWFAYEKRNHPEAGYHDLIRFIETINYTEDDAFAPAMFQRLDLPNYLDYVATMMLTGNVGFTAANYFLYHDVERGQWVIIPWGLGASFGFSPFLAGGNGWATPIDLGAEGVLPEYVTPNRLFTRVLQVDAFRDYIAGRLNGLIAGVFQPGVMNPIIDGTFDHIAFDARRDVRKAGWERNNLLELGPEELKAFVAQRGPFLLSELDEFTPNGGPYLHINELMSDNVSSVTDEFGEHDPWIEIYHAGVSATPLSGKYITNDVADPTRWPIPGAVTLDGGSHLIVWADGEPEEGPLHASFTLDPAGGTVALFDSDGQTLISQMTYGPLGEDESSARQPDGSDEIEATNTATPGDWNYLVNAAPTVSDTRREPLYPTADDAVTVTAIVEDDGAVASGTLVIDIGTGPASIPMYDDGQHDDEVAGDSIYGASIPAAPNGIHISYYVLATDDEGATSTDPVGAPESQYTYIVGEQPTFTPAPGAALHAKHVLIKFDADLPGDSYQLQIAIDDIGRDPFAAAPIVDKVLSRPRDIVRDGLEFGEHYAWRVRNLSAEEAWSETRRFSIVPFPYDNIEEVMELTLNNPAGYQPGYTLFNLWAIPGGDTLDKEFLLAVDREGEVIFFLRMDTIGLQTSGDVRQLRNGNLLVAKPPEAIEFTLNGDVVWSTEAFAMEVDNHEAYDMPNGNVMLLIQNGEEVERNGDIQLWGSEILTEITRDGESVWSWNTFDHLSTLDFDDCMMQFPTPNGVYDWTHGNGVVYDAVERAVYYSPRHLSRIVKIDYDTGDVIWNLGIDMPSGDVDFVYDIFTFQHAPQVLANGNVVLYDNGNRRGGTYCDDEDTYSAAVELHVDPEAPEPVTVVWEYQQDLFSPTKGDADRLPNGNTLVTAGHAGSAVVEEVSQGGDVVWKMSFPFPAAMYRAERVASLYPLRGDADGDDRIGLIDYGGFQACYAGADDLAIHRDCLLHDYDEDGDVDHQDFAQIQSPSNGIAGQ